MTRAGVAVRRVVTCDPAHATADDPLGVLTDAVVVHEGGVIRWLGARANAPVDVAVVDYGDRVVTPGLVDAHTHAAWVGSRHDEYAMRMAGADYRAIAAAGGGIVSSHRAVMAATEEHIATMLEQRLRRMASLGVTTCEVKSGYGLLPEEEKKQLRAMTKAHARDDLPRLVRTFLALHALPPSERERRDEYVRHVAHTLIPEVVREGLADFVDAYVDANAFTTDEARLVCGEAKKHGLGIRLHVGQFADVGGAELAAELGAHSADHLEHVGSEGIAALARAKVAAILLPTASFTLGQSPPPVAALRDARVALVVASDANPGTAPTESLPLAMALAVRNYGVSPSEAILGATRHAAESLTKTRTPEYGALRIGAAADFVVWDLPHENAIVQPWGLARTNTVMRAGRRIA